MVAHVKKCVQELGPMNAILVNGDVANAGKAEEYDAAREWLSAMTKAGACKKENILFVPGNHDVSRSVISGNVSVRNAQNAIITAADREWILNQQISDDEAGRNLLKPLGEYNSFVAPYDCSLFLPHQLSWAHDFLLGHGFKLRINGLTSTLLSSAWIHSDKRDELKGELYLSPFQTVLDPVPGVVHMVMCHHPPPWFHDGDAVEDALKGRAAIHLFGHEHKQRVVKAETFIKFAAGAVNPNRQEAGWEPGFNIIEVSIEKENTSTFLNVIGHLYVWQPNDHSFVTKNHAGDAKSIQHRIPVRVEADLEASECSCIRRNLTYRFWGLSIEHKKAIVDAIPIGADNGAPKSTDERHARFLHAVFTSGKAKELEQEIQRRGA